MYKFKADNNLYHIALLITIAAAWNLYLIQNFKV